MIDAGEAVPTSAMRRLHPATIPVDLIHTIGSIAWMIAIVVVVRFVGGDSDWFEYVISDAFRF